MNGIGRITPSGTITLFPLADQQWGVTSMATGADGNLWFTDGDDIVGRMTPGGSVTEFSTGRLAPMSIGNGLNGNLVATATNGRGNDTVFQMSTAGAIATYKVPAAISNAFEFDLGAADGSLWFSWINRLGRITASGRATAYPMSEIVGNRGHSVESMAIGGNGDLYLIDSDSETVNRIAPSQLPRVRTPTRSTSRR